MGRNKLALIAEPKAIDGAYFKLLLERKGWHAEIVSSAKEVIKKLAENKYSILFINSSISISDGKEIKEKLIQLEKNGQGKVKVIGVSSSTLEAERIGMMENGVDYCLKKPVYNSSLETVLETFHDSGHQMLSMA
ncbi:response regulator [Flexithrix dorotheae]|uniref:response regulator n=1 Tax=Flexithrix dorotheae TaxID=70993 RepID=UPI0003788948|nr:response regulator [Flexithrix dorotheae]